MNIEAEKCTHTFIPFARRKINEIDIDITGCKSAYEAYAKVKNCAQLNKSDLYRINLIGEINFDVDRLADDVERLLADSCYFISIKDKTRRKINISQYEKDLSIKGEFIRIVYNNTELDNEEKMTIINCGLKALDGKEIEL